MNTQNIHDSWTGDTYKTSNGQRIVKIFRSVPELDIEIRKMSFPFEEQDYYDVEIGLFESIGEQGEIFSLWMDTEPTVDEIIKEMKVELKQMREQLNGTILSGREEKYLEILNKLEI